MNSQVKRRKGEAGQAVLLMVLGLSFFLLGALGLGIDGSHLYAQYQMAQAAADAAAQAGIMSIFDGTNTGATYGASSPYTTPAAYTCTTSDVKTPCKYAASNGFGTASGDSVTIQFGDSTTSSAPAGIPLSPKATDSISWMTVTVTRNVPTMLMRLLGPGATTISVSGTAAIVNVVSPVPIIITHPTMAGALSMNGNTSITITGGPQQSVQINSNGTNPAGAAFVGPSAGSVDLSKAGPNGTGGDFGTFGGPSTNPGDVSLGSTGHYLAPSSPVLDPLAGVPAPAMPTTAGSASTCTTNCGSCPGGATTCDEYTPGLYVGGINLKNTTAMFDPGIYYLQGGGFTTKNSTVGMCSSCASDPTTVNGMLLYDTGPASGGCDATGGFTIDTNSNDVFWGAGVSGSNPTAAPGAPYYGILFFEDRNACTQTHTLGKGNGCFSVIGTIYLTNTLTIMQSNPSQYQTAAYNGTPCTGVQNYGEIIVSHLSVVGNSSVSMGLFPTGILKVRQVALVQ